MIRIVLCFILATHTYTNKLDSVLYALHVVFTFRSLGYDKNSTMFYTGDSPLVNITRDLTITNTFNFTLVIYNVSLGDEMREYFSVSTTSANI